MKYTSSAPVWLFVVLGAAGTWLHRMQVSTCYDDSGYIISGRPLTALLIGLCLLLALLAVVYGFICSRRQVLLTNAAEAFAPRRPLFYLPAMWLGALGLIAFSVCRFLLISGQTKAELAACLLALASGIGVFPLSLSLAQRKSSRAAAYLSAVIGVFFCLWMVLHFAGNTKNPVLLSFCTECVAMGSTCLFLFALGSPAVGTTQNFTTVCFGLLSAGFSLLALTGQQVDLCDRLVLAASLLLVVPNLITFLHNVPLKKKQ